MTHLVNTSRGFARPLFVILVFTLVAMGVFVALDTLIPGFSSRGLGGWVLYGIGAILLILLFARKRPEQDDSQGDEPGASTGSGAQHPPETLEEVRTRIRDRKRRESSQE